MNLKQLQAAAQTAQMDFRDYLLFLIANGGTNGTNLIQDLINSIRGFSGGFALSTIQVQNKALKNVPVGIYLPVSGNNASINGGVFYNPNNVPVFLKFCDELVADVTVGVTPVAYKLMIPALGQIVLDSTTYYCNFLTEMTAYCTTGYLDADTTAPVTGIELITTIADTSQNP